MPNSSRFRTLIVLVAALGVVAIAGCSDSGESVDAGASTTTVARTPTTGDTATTDPSTTLAPTTDGTTATTAPATVAPTSAPAPDSVLLLPDGIGTFVFGNPQSAVIDGMSAVLGAPEETHPAECGSGSDTIVVFEGASLVFGADTFAGWSWGRAGVGPSVPGATTEGVTVGSSVAEAKAAFGTDFAFQEDSTLGDEFYVGTDYPGIGGFTTGTSDTDTITSLYGGDLCAFR